eukprot:TRINITY_DN641_c0_g1_i3.p1 TRINITY_DN641_c0_g1~~TRINITY_DN641_c0_g1_i3.p1  ORF type:complete len:441 (-),score=100.24 TRINITY_DN641_c0_g1_i3:69-1391(-)
MSVVNGVKSFGIGGLGGIVGVVLAKYFLPEPEPKLKQNEEVASSLPPKTSSILKYGTPSFGVNTIMKYENHVLEYDPVRKVPKWVAEHISEKKAFGSEANRKMSKFDRDPSIPHLFSSDNRDFRGSGWSRGHMAPAGNNKHSQAAMNQTFYLTNIVPQDLDNNGNYWNRLEIYCRELTKQYSDVYVISGPLWLPEMEENAENIQEAYSPIRWKHQNDDISEKGDRSSNEKPKKGGWKPPPKKFVKYQVLGKSNVAVPTHLFKIILVEDPSLERPMLGAFVVPNKPIQNVRLREFEVDLEEIEKYVGVRFHQDLDRSQVASLCLDTGCKLNDYREFQDFFWNRSMSNPWNMHQLERDWKTICERGLKTEKLEQVYLTKKQEFLDKQKEAKEDEKVVKAAGVEASTIKSNQHIVQGSGGDTQSVESSATKSEQPAVQLAAAA